MNYQKPILVTGAHRSGTTWAGKMISTAGNVGYIHEPFNINERIGVSPNTFKYWFTHIDGKGTQDYYDTFGDILSFRYPFTQNLARLRSARCLAKLIRDQGLSTYHRFRMDRPLMKDPIAFFSSEWLAENFNMDVLVLIRHPAAFCSSLKLMNWTFDFNNFINQPRLMEKYLFLFNEEISDFARNQADIVDQGILLWNCIHHTVAMYQERHPDWLFVRHEDLSLNPCHQFRLLYVKLNLEFTPKARRAVERSSGIHNPIEQTPGQEFQRNSRKSINNWKRLLSRSEIDKIRAKTADVSTQYYDASEWRV